MPNRYPFLEYVNSSTLAGIFEESLATATENSTPEAERLLFEAAAEVQSRGPQVYVDSILIDAADVIGDQTLPEWENHATPGTCAGECDAHGV
jgi:hypothetical protein